jgi:hypothetical protein
MINIEQQLDTTSDPENSSNNTGLLYTIMDGLVGTVASRAPWTIFSFQTLDFDLEEDEEKLERPVSLRRTLSEEIHSVVHSRQSSLGKKTLWKSIFAARAAPEEESRKDDPLQYRPALRRTLSDGPSPDKRKRNHTISRPGLFVTRAFRRSSSRLYTEISGTFEEDDDEEDELGFLDNSWKNDDDNDDSLGLQNPTVLFSDEEDVELGQSGGCD